MRVLDGVRARSAFRAATRVGDGVRVFGWPRVANEGELVIGRGATFVAKPAPVDILVAPGGRLVIGNGALIESGAAIRVKGRVSIGDGARVGVGCIIDDDGPSAGEIVIGDGAWVEDHAVLLQSARLSAGSFVARAAPPAHHGASSSPSSPDADRLALEVDGRVRAVLARLVLGASNVDRTTDLTEVKGWDSLAALRVLVALEKEFAVVLPHQLLAKSPSLETVTPVIMARVSGQMATR
jgi:acyl carrier protein